MQRGQGGRDDFFGFRDPFAGFGGFGRPGSFFPSIFGGKNPFDDPFFTRPMESMFGPSLFGGRAFGDMNHGGFIEEQAPQSSKSKGPIIRELSDDDDDNVEEERDEDNEEKNNPRKHLRLSKEPYVQDPDEEAEEKKMKHTDYRTVYDIASRVQPQARTFSFSSSSVIYDGPNGPYYTASTTRMCGGDGVTIEESKEADRTTGKAAHRLSRGLRDKGHSVTRKRNSDGRVDTMQTLHNLNQDELPNFNEAWNGSAREHLRGWNQGFDMIDNGDITGGGRRQNEQPSRGWALPLMEQPSTNSAGPRPKFHPYLLDGRPK
ncbi:hypothetical protein J5N97_025532 [Dioscorea zingiberensis]|uniref:Uncharacterized protein n=1 Tax=Dioscorea zingiberensis TaxID=325984 RepID=A0A9D5C923_9LILI|nr:hypothetical protein J5N97_025532 [Dioscorea zingiberensis]